MITVLVSNQDNYPVSSSKIQKELSNFLNEQGVTHNTEVSVALISEEKILAISNEYLKDDIVHDVLSFPYSEVKGKFIDPPDGIKRLGEIFICYPLISGQAIEEGISIDEKILLLAKHGALHLLGIHHN